MVSEHRDDRDLHLREILREQLGFVGQAVVREIAAQHENVSGLGDLREERLQAALASSSSSGCRRAQRAGQLLRSWAWAWRRLRKESGQLASLALAFSCAETTTRAMAYQSTLSHPERDTNAFYRRTLHVLSDAQVPFLVGGSHALLNYTGIARPTKDFDLFLRRSNIDAALGALGEAGYDTEITFRHWLAKARDGNDVVDLVFNSGNGICSVDDEWFAHAIEADVLGMPVKIAPVEELLWQKTFVMERERYDGADVAHIIRSCAETLDWDRIVRRFGRPLAAAAVLRRPVRVHLPVGPAPHSRARLERSHRAAAARDQRRTERRSRLPRHAHVPRAVSARHRPVRLLRRAATTERQHVRRGRRVLDVGDRACDLI